MIKYFVSYFYKARGGDEWGFGSSTVTRSAPISTDEDIILVRDQVRKKNHFDGVVVINWRRFEES